MLIYIDLETTGVSDSDVICSVGVVYEQNYLYELVNESKKIPPQASAIHHITNEMIKDKPKFAQTQSFAFLMQHNNANATLVGHNIAFDLKMLAKHGFFWEGRVIDTLRLSRHLIEDCESYGLQFLRYELRLYRLEAEMLKRYGIKDALVAHHALSDALLVVMLYEYHTSMVSLDEMVELTKKRVLLQKVPFGKYKNRYFEELLIENRGYLEWMLGLGEIDEDLRCSLEHYLRGE